jgi:periplasmic divalent cation tolerance protein
MDSGLQGVKSEFWIARGARRGFQRAMQPDELMVGWTTVDDAVAAGRIARGLVESGLAACTQVDGPVTSCYHWKGNIEQAVENRITVKFAAANARAIEEWLAAHHPYEIHQWVACRADAVAEKYLKWVLSLPT